MDLSRTLISCRQKKKRENEFTESELDVRAIYKSNSQDDKRKAG
jgi:hypothetical protein